jgi:aminoglycoside phosphotransferase (APT) family kinase protein
MRDSTSIAAMLVAEAGMGSIVRVEPTAAGSNANDVVTAENGTRAVVRRYRELPAPHRAAARLRRERWALETLREAGAPVARVLAVNDVPGAEALLLEFVDGELLGNLALRRDADASVPAWRSAGSALAAVHAIEAAHAAAAGCEDAGVRAPHVSRGPYHRQEALERLYDLARSRPDLGSLEPLQAIVERALPLYERAPLAMSQSDVHLWQFVHAGNECVAILDWEHVDLDDPDWDLAQLDVFRFAPVRETPKAFFEGYGRMPTSPLYTLYRLERAAWILDAYTRGEDWVALSVPLAERFVRGLLERNDALRRSIDRAL